MTDTAAVKPMAVDLFCGLGGWTDGLLAEGWDVLGFDIERHVYGSDRYPAQLVIRDVLTIDGRKFRGKVDLIVASPPCQEFSYMAMPWTRAKQIAQALRGRGAFPTSYTGSRTKAELTRLFDAALRIGREAQCPVVIENVRGAQPWVGQAKANYGSFYLWGDVPAVPHFGDPFPVPGKSGVKVPMPPGGDSLRIGFQQEAKLAERATKNEGGSWFAIANNTTSGHSKNPVHAGVKAALAVQDAMYRVQDAVKHGGDWFSDPASPSRQGGISYTGVKQAGISGPRDNGKGDAWFQDGAARHGSKSSARKAASARIAKIPERLSRWIARYYLPKVSERVA